MAGISADGPRGISTFIVEKNTPGVSFAPNEAKMGWNAQPTAQVIFEGARVPADAMLGGTKDEGTGFGIAITASTAAGSTSPPAHSAERTPPMKGPLPTFGTGRHSAHR
jgi:alkylation response protein AidB-like acyl-CoA dehydrogenase